MLMVVYSCFLFLRGDWYCSAYVRIVGRTGRGVEARVCKNPFGLRESEKRRPARHPKSSGAARVGLEAVLLASLDGAFADHQGDHLAGVGVELHELLQAALGLG